MKSKQLLATIFVLPLALASCSKNGEAASNGGPDNYPLKDCVVSGEPLGSMGDPYVIEHGGTTVKFCCKNCLPKFNTAPETYVAKIK